MADSMRGESSRDGEAAMGEGKARLESGNGVVVSVVVEGASLSRMTLGVAAGVRGCTATGVGVPGTLDSILLIEFGFR